MPVKDRVLAVVSSLERRRSTPTGNPRQHAGIGRERTRRWGGAGVDQMIPSDLRNQVVEAIDLVALALDLGLTLHRAGRLHVGSCPFHTEKTASFAVYDDHFHCFGCEAHGTAIDLVMRLLAMTYPESLHWLAARAGIAIDDVQHPATPRTVVPSRHRPGAERDEIRRKLAALELRRQAIAVTTAGSPESQESALDELASLTWAETLLHARVAELEAGSAEPRYA